MIPGGSSNSCFPSVGPHGPSSIYGYGVPVPDQDHGVSEAQYYSNPPADPADPANFFMYNLSVLKDKVHQLQSLATMFSNISSSDDQQSTAAMAVASMGTLVQEIIVTASSLMFTCQHISLGGTTPSGLIHTNHHSTTSQLHPNHHRELTVSDQPAVHRQNDSLEWYGDHSYNNCNIIDNNNITGATVLVMSSNHNEAAGRGRGDLLAQKVEKNEGGRGRGRGRGRIISMEKSSPKSYDIVELNAADLLAKYTHYCQVCGKGFKRDANLRMHMRAHGDEYKSSSALINPLKKKNNTNNIGKLEEAEADDDDHDDHEGLIPKKLPRKYSCPQEGCRWNKKHAKFQPLKSMICVKNHYKRSHCPKMYVCKRCNGKQYSVLSDLRTHEKHCGDILKWQCSCDTTFSRKDKLLGHVALFIGHAPSIASLVKMGKFDHQNPGDTTCN